MAQLYTLRLDAGNEDDALAELAAFSRDPRSLSKTQAAKGPTQA